MKLFDEVLVSFLLCRISPASLGVCYYAFPLDKITNCFPTTKTKFLFFLDSFTDHENTHVLLALAAVLTDTFPIVTYSDDGVS